jgi:hypothetical protein
MFVARGKMTHVAMRHIACAGTPTTFQYLYSVGATNRLDSEYPDDVSDSERRVGFERAESATETRVVIHLGYGLRAVKVRKLDGSVEYAVCNDDYEPLYPPAQTLDELRTRFGLT